MISLVSEPQLNQNEKKSIFNVLYTRHYTAQRTQYTLNNNKPNKVEGNIFNR